MTSERATKFKLEAPFHISKPNYGPAYHIRFYWLLFLIAVMALMIMFLV